MGTIVPFVHNLFSSFGILKNINSTLSLVCLCNTFRVFLGTNNSRSGTKVGKVYAVKYDWVHHKPTCLRHVFPSIPNNPLRIIYNAILYYREHTLLASLYVCFWTYTFAKYKLNGNLINNHGFLFVFCNPTLGHERRFAIVCKCSRKENI